MLPADEPVYPGSMIAMDCIMRQRVEQVQTLHALALLFDASFSQVRPCRSSCCEMLSTMHRWLQLHSSSWSYRARATFVRFFRDCFMPIALQLDACLFASVGGGTAELIQLPGPIPNRASVPSNFEDGREDDFGENASSLLSRWHKGIVGENPCSRLAAT
jgi:hypothetical protein